MSSESIPVPPPPPSESVAPRAPELSAGVRPRVYLPLALALLVVAAGIGYHQFRRSALREVIFRELNLKADIKARELTTWREERISEARFLMRAPAVATDIAALLAQLDSAVAQRAVNGWLSTMKGGARYEAVLLLDAEKKIVVAFPPSDTATCPLVTGLPATALAGREPYFSDLHRNPSGTAAHFDLVAPILPPSTSAENPRAAPVAFVVMRIHPEEVVFPLLSRWPDASASAEILLIRQEGNDIVHLNPYRHRSGGVLARHPLRHDPEAPGAFAVRADNSVREGTDYRGEAVLTATRAVPNTDWIMIAKIDRAEAFASLQHETWIAAGFVVLLLATLRLGHAYLDQTRQGALLQRTLAAEHQGKVLAERLALVSHYAGVAILLADESQQIIEANERAQSTYGLTLEELRQRRLGDLRSPKAGSTPANTLAGIGSEDSTTFETEHARADGSTFPVEVSVRRVQIGGQPHLLEVIRDMSERKQAEAAREAEQQRHRILFSTSPQPMWVYDPETLAFLEVNDTAVRNYGFSRQEFLAMTIKDIRPPSEVPALLADLGRGHDRSRSAGIWRHRRKDGSELMVEVSAESIVLAERKVRLVVAIDVTDRLQSEQALRESETRFRQIFENSLDAILLTSPEGQIFAANPAACRMLDRTEAELRRGGREGIIDATDPRLAALLAERTRHGQARGELRFRRTDGTTFEAEAMSAIFQDSQGRPRASMVIHDITARKAAMAALQESEGRFRTILETAPDAIFIQAKGRFAYVNPATVRLFGAQRTEDLLEQPLPDRMAPEYRVQALERMRQLNEERKALPVVEGIFLKLDGTRMTVELTAVPITYRGTPGALVFARDITGRKQAELSLRASETRARAILEAMPAAVFIQSQNQFAYVNPTALQLFGATQREELVGRPILERVMPESVAVSQARMERTNERREVAPRGEVSFKRIDGSPVVTEVISIPFDYDGTPGALVFAVNITARRAAEQARAEQVEELRRWQAITLGRENRLLELKREINDLLARAGQPVRYESAEDSGAPPPPAP